MENGKLTLSDIRLAIHSLGDEGLSEEIRGMSDDVFAKADFFDDLGLDSLDIAEITVALQRDCNVGIADGAIDDFVANGYTVHSMLDSYNNNLS